MTRSHSVEMTQLGRTGFQISRIGFGGYRIEEGNHEHEESLNLALRSGINLIDTSTNYTDGSSEKLIGKVLKQHNRSDVTLVTKVGYVQGENLALARKRMQEGKPFPEMVQYQSGIWHCISPEFLEDQISRSLERLAVKEIDVLLLHNPEYYLKTEDNHPEYYRRIKNAFEYLETEVARGRIRHYGVSSNTFPDPRESPEYTSLETLVSLAEEISPHHHFSVIQFPFNLFEPGAAFEQNNGSTSVLEFARSKNIGTLINRPLNAFHQRQLVRLADFPDHPLEKTAENLQKTLEDAMRLESSYPKSARDLVPVKEIAWAHILKENMNRLSELGYWRDVLQYQIGPSLKLNLATLNKTPDFSDWSKSYERASSSLFNSFTEYLETMASRRSSHLASVLNKAAPELKSNQSLSQKAVRIYESLPGLHCVLVGMRKPAYVKDMLGVGEPISAEKAQAALDKILEESDSTHDELSV
jgi:aryl-alcohol dehydrogenase-like predicted oxidoreductase